jgi:hypothetical protein
MARLIPYDPINTVKPVAPDVWIVDGPEIAMAYAGGSTIPFTTRMSVIRLPDGSLWVHSPTALTDCLAAEIDALGLVRHIVAPNRIHYWWVGDWKKRYPNARTYAAPKVVAQARKKGRFHAFDATLGEEAPAAWQDVIEQVVVPGGFMSEVDFFHKPSKTLVLTDLIENFEPKRVKSPLLRALVQLSGAAAPDGAMPLDLRLTFLFHRRAVREAVEKMLGWQPQRVLLCHGQWYQHDAEARLRNAFRWIL